MINVISKTSYSWSSQGHNQMVIYCSMRKHSHQHHARHNISGSYLRASAFC